ncbi:MAG: hypothetical protein QW385_07570 [Thermoproteota archaeon]|nr:hypothetical protein [Candidatus Bathyarchaeota archaeon]
MRLKTTQTFSKRMQYNTKTIVEKPFLYTHICLTELADSGNRVKYQLPIIKYLLEMVIMFDIETTGLDPYENQVILIGMKGRRKIKRWNL